MSDKEKTLACVMVEGEKYYHETFVKEFQRVNKELEEENQRLREALEWYTSDKINQHNYHSVMNTDLTLQARLALTDLKLKPKQALGESDERTRPAGLG